MSAQAWFAEDGGQFEGAEPFFFDPDKFAWVKDVEAQWEVVRDELQGLLASDRTALEPYMNAEMTSRPNRWKTFGMMFWTFKSKENAAKCPKTWAILKNIPNITAASFNLLEPNTTIKPHHGDTNAIIRCHMGLKIPAPAPRCGFRVGDETRSWENGKFLMFCDAYEHTAWNNTDEDRYILVVDIMRPEFARQEKSIAARTLASINLAVACQRSALLKRIGNTSLGKWFLFNVLRAGFRASMLMPGARSAAH